MRTREKGLFSQYNEKVSCALKGTCQVICFLGDLFLGEWGNRTAHSKKPIIEAEKAKRDIPPKSCTCVSSSYRTHACITAQTDSAYLHTSHSRNDLYFAPPVRTKLSHFCSQCDSAKREVHDKEEEVNWRHGKIKPLQHTKKDKLCSDSLSVHILSLYTLLKRAQVLSLLHNVYETPFTRFKVGVHVLPVFLHARSLHNRKAPDVGHTQYRRQPRDKQEFSVHAEMEKLEIEFDKMKLRNDSGAEEEEDVDVDVDVDVDADMKAGDDDEPEGEEKISNRKLRYQKMKDKKEEKKRKKQNAKSASNNRSSMGNTKGKGEIKDEQKACKNEDEHGVGNLARNPKDDANEGQNDMGTEPSKTNRERFEPVHVEYCKGEHSGAIQRCDTAVRYSVCGMPYEYCEYGTSFKECKEENKEKYNYDVLNNGTEGAAKKQGKKPTQSVSVPVHAACVRLCKNAYCSQQSYFSMFASLCMSHVTQKITIQKTTRARKKVVTVVTGLHAYVKLDKMAKIFSRFYACGSSVIKGANNNPDQIDIQVSVSRKTIQHNIVEIIMKNCPEVTEDLFVILPSK
ncbi:translation initiation factor SUI1, putative [Plasmodium ovale wallikeri]|uniref:Translation initiation factor SUI1, putative n=1 Tax=Plasmodium ovale wallikeri TaxID=864142 RepID=A0A1A8ZWH6_PLAOA|nr:translation initiation factor SUI1, putative [Plasmodium ovale wallikeri]SBT48481.1 translation initiation factor SUI1, putative [Plasmodium ovale wallikeri]